MYILLILMLIFVLAKVLGLISWGLLLVFSLLIVTSAAVKLLITLHEE